MENNTRRIHPLIAVAAVSVTLFSLAGVAVLTGVMPGSKAEPTPAVATAAVPAPVAPLATSAPTAAEPVPATPAVAPAPPAPHEGKVVHKSKPAPKQLAAKETPIMPVPAGEPATHQPPPAPVCHNCGTVESVRQVVQEGQGTGLGAVAGGVLGGVLGHQVGHGRGNDLATVLGAAGGAYAGHRIEKSQRSSTSYDVAVRLDDGSYQTIRFKEQPAWREGERVKVVDGGLVAAGQ